MRTDIPLASSISGGIDSSSVLATVAELGHGSRTIDRLPSSWQRAYFAWAPGTRSDERRYADVAIAAVRAEPRIFDVRSVSLSSDIERCLFETEGRRVQSSRHRGRLVSR
jgi:asparagine synthetase B (glutamine-hydrolysing)